LFVDRLAYRTNHPTVVWEWKAVFGPLLANGDVEQLLSIHVEPAIVLETDKKLHHDPIFFLQFHDVNHSALLASPTSMFRNTMEEAVGIQKYSRSLLVPAFLVITAPAVALQDPVLKTAPPWPDEALSWSKSAAN